MIIIIKRQEDIENQSNTAKKAGKTLGFVPTMGALHEGHLSLIKKSKKENDLTICSIFVNPTQFNDKKDFDAYPITMAKDIEMLVSAGCDILFSPDVQEMYPDGFVNATKVDFGFLAATLEGEFRPGHFDGMAQIVEKLLQMVKPTRLYMGQKDYQQAMICNELIKKRKIETQLVVCPIKRENDGLAMSSRNVRLTDDNRDLAPIIHQTLKKAKAALKAGKKTIAEIEIESFNLLKSIANFKPEYFAIRDAISLKKVNEKHKEQKVILVACWVGEVRLIDNILI